MRVPDLSLAVRNVFRRPGFALVAIALLALGAGANAAVFSVVRGVLLRPLPYPAPERLVAIWPGESISNQEIAYWRDHTRSFEEIAAQAPGWMMGLVAEGGEPIKVTAARVSDNLFKTLGATAALGRTVEPGDSVPGRHRVVVLSDGLWRSRFAADPNVIGRSVQLDQDTLTVIGVMPGAFEILEPGTDLWAPLAWEPGASSFRTTFSQGIARLKPGVTVEAATLELQRVTPDLRRQLSRATDWGQTVRAASLQETITGDVRPALLILLGAVGLILMLAAVNLGTLVLGRSIDRIGEMAVRTALGASRARLVRQVIVEQAVLAVLGALAGIGVAQLALPGLIALIPAEMPRVGQIALDWTVLVSVLAASIGVAVVVALVPALLAARTNVQSLLRQSRVTDTPSRRRALGALVAVQIGLAVVLGIGSLLMLRSLWNLQQVHPGFEPAQVLSFRLQTTAKYRGLSTGLPYLEQMSARVAALPGVSHVGLIGHPPMSGYSWTVPVSREDQPAPAGTEPPQVGWRFIEGEYFAAMGIPVRYGRTFTLTDGLTAPRVAIVNETLARQYFGDPSQAVGRRLVQHGGGSDRLEPLEIVAVVGDVRHRGLDQAVIPEMFRPLRQTFMFPMAMVARTAGPPEQLAAAVRQAAFDIDPVVPVAELQPYSTMIADTLGRPRLLGFLLTVFAAAGLSLGLVGVYGVVAYRVRQREREIGIRLALGAAPSSVARGVVRQGISHALAGVALGLPAAYFLSRVMATLVFGVTATDPLTFAALPALVIVVTAAACYLPARRAAHIDPVVALKQD